MKEYRRIILYILMLMFVVIQPFTYYTVSAGANITLKYNGSSKSANKKNLENMWAFFTEKGFSEEATAGIIGNAIVESGLNTKAKSKSGNYIGMFQWSKDKRWVNCKDWNTKRGYDYNSVKGQCLFIIEEMKVDFGDGSSKIVSYKEFKKLTDVQKASDQFMMKIERCINSGGTTYVPECYQHYKDRRNMSAAVYEKYTGKKLTFNEEGSTSTTSGGAVTSNNGGSSTTGSYGGYDESRYIATERPLNEKEVTFAEGSDLSYDEKKNLEALKETTQTTWLATIITMFRGLVAFAGILLTVYCIFAYLIYWFDRVNSLMDFSFLKIVTAGRLSTSMDDESTYGTDIEGTKEVNHSDIMRLCIMGIFMGMLLVSGWIYRFLGYVWTFAMFILSSVIGMF